MEQSTIKSPQAGIAIFSDPNDLIGKPVAIGQELMLIANPEKIELLIRVPTDAMIELNNNAAITFFPNSAPLSNFQGHLISSGYQASADPDGLLTYKLRATIDNSEQLRIGWKGTAKIKGDWSFLGYSILRRPIIALRNILGV